MNILAIGYLVASTAQIVAGLPQIRKLVKSKNAESFSLTTWGMWGATQGVCLAYNVSLGDPVLISLSTLWMVYFVSMLGLIVYYRWPQQLALRQKVLVTDDAAQPVDV